MLFGLGGVVAVDRDIEKMGPSHSFVHHELGRDCRHLTRLQGCRTDNRSRRSTSLDDLDRDLSFGDLQRLVAHVFDSKDRAHRFVVYDTPEINSLSIDGEPRARRLTRTASLAHHLKEENSQ